jgi:hypothetical protein
MVYLRQKPDFAINDCEIHDFTVGYFEDISHFKYTDSIIK